MSGVPAFCGALRADSVELKLAESLLECFERDLHQRLELWLVEVTDLLLAVLAKVDDVFPVSLQMGLRDFVAQTIMVELCILELDCKQHVLCRLLSD